MRNAGKIDMEMLTYGQYKYIKKVMFNCTHPWGGTFKVHAHRDTTFGNMDDAILVETAEGSLLIVERSWLSSVSRKQGSPKKQRRVCKKGTKPNLGLGVPYDATLAIPGAKVVCRNGVIYTLTKEVEHLNDTYALESFNLINGKHYWYDQYDILRVIIEEDKPQVSTDNTTLVDYDYKLIKDGCKVVTRCGITYTIVFNNADYYKYALPYGWCHVVPETGEHKGGESAYDIMKIIIDKPKQDPYNGYSVGDWHFWDGKTSVPPVGKDVVVEYWLRSSPHKAPETQTARSLWWGWSNKHTRGSDIIAFKIIP